MVKATASKTLNDLHDPVDDATVQLLQLAARLHAARGDPTAWQIPASSTP